MGVTACRLCGAECEHPLLLANRRFHPCPRCRLVQADPSEFLDETAERERYRLHDNTAGNAGYVQMLRGRADALRARALLREPVLDFGCGEHAVLAALLRDDGLDADGYDPLFGHVPPPRRYATVFALEVVEHLRDPRAGFEKMASLLSPGGTLAVSTRTADDVTDLASWWYVQDTTHVDLYYRATLAYAARQYGFGEPSWLADDFLIFL